MVTNSILYVGRSDAQSLGRERALVANGIRVASVSAPEAAVTYVKNSEVRVVLLDDAAPGVDLSSVAGSLKVANPGLRIIALTSSEDLPEYVDTVLQKPIELEKLLDAVQHNLALRQSAG
ncbi:MAG TPA: hypothetical protein VGL89_03810 [Candidatus Koribacter sp.]|jgi:DNA-binding NtrC family response regulator